MQIGIIGLPNVGKSTLFNALTKLSVPAENFPFTTIEPNVGVVPVPDTRLARLGELFRPQKLTSASIRFVDIAGLVKGASKGEGLGNKFLSHIREMDALVQVVRGFAAGDVVSVIPSADPQAEREIIQTELILADLEQAQRALERLSGAAKSGDKEAREQTALLEKVTAGLDRGLPVREQQGLPAEGIAPYQFLTAKPVLFVLNVDEGSCDRAKEGYLPICVKLEAEIVQLPETEQASFRAEMGLAESGLEKLVRAAFSLLDLVTFYTVVGTEVRAWNIRRGSTILEAAGKIHTDMARGFIRADVYRFDDLAALGSEKALQEKGLIRSEGREYPVRDGDVVRVHFKVPQ